MCMIGLHESKMHGFADWLFTNIKFSENVFHNRTIYIDELGLDALRLESDIDKITAPPDKKPLTGTGRNTRIAVKSETKRNIA